MPRFDGTPPTSSLSVSAAMLTPSAIDTSAFGISFVGGGCSRRRYGLSPSLLAQTTTSSFEAASGLQGCGTVKSIRSGGEALIAWATAKENSTSASSIDHSTLI